MHGLTKEDFDYFHAEIQKVLEPAVKKAAASLGWRVMPEKVSTELFPLASYVSILEPDRANDDDLVFEVAVTVHTGAIVIHADACGGSSGTVFVELPKFPLLFGTPKPLVLEAVVAAARELAGKVGTAVDAWVKERKKV